jgi:hypothetical protein
MRILLIPAVLLLAGAPAVARDRTIPIVTPAGKDVSCVQVRQIRQTHVRSDKIIDFEMQGGKVFRNELPYSCPQLGFEERFSYRVSTGSLCSVDTITVLQNTGGLSAGASCGLGRFQPVKLTKQQR